MGTGTPKDQNHDPITEWLNQLPSGNSMAQREFWEKFATRIERIANRQLQGVQRRDSDGEDVAVRVMNSLFQRLADGRMEPPPNRDELWALLLGMTRNKSYEVARNKRAKKRGGGKVRGESAVGAEHDRGPLGLDAVADTKPDPAQAFAEASALVDRLQAVTDPEMRRIVLLRMAGHTNEEIAAQLGCGLRTIERRLARIRDAMTDRDF